MSGRRLRRLVLLALVIGVGYWIYKDRPTVSGFIDSLTSPLLGSKAAVEESERNRVVGDASTVAAEQSDAAVGTIREGMSTYEVKDLLGEPEKQEEERTETALRLRWTYSRLHRVLVFQDGRVISIAIK
ncbi:MAG TPA: hypothetical protein VFA98_13170 [Thermoanaerobaculia bacterium]|nr:hypothetical protein [Thermoanaerobaculia bacterium]